MPLPSVPSPRLALLLRSGVLLGKAVARLFPGKFDPLCLRTKGGETMWSQNLRYIWQACPFLDPLWLQAIEEGSVEAAQLSLLKVTVEALSPKARKHCLSVLDAASEVDTRTLLWRWAWHCSGVTRSSPPDLPALMRCLEHCGVIKHSETDDWNQMMQGSFMEGMQLTEPVALDALEVVLLWAISSSRTKSKLSIVRQSSDTSWIAKAQDEKK